MLLKKYGLERVSVAGDTRFDRVSQLALTEYSQPCTGVIFC